MADPDRAVEVHRNGVVSGSVTRRGPDAIVADIERTRQDLARAIDSIAERVSPANNIRRLRERAAEQASRPEVQLAAAAVGLAMVGLVALRIWARRRR
jgi:anti-sigma factor RsiW